MEAEATVATVAKVARWVERVEMARAAMEGSAGEVTKGEEETPEAEVAVEVQMVGKEDMVEASWVLGEAMVDA